MRRPCSWRSLGAAIFAATLLGAHSEWASADCVDDSAAFHAVNPNVLRAILWGESRMNAKAVNRNRNGSIDVGIGQINTLHFNELRSLGVTPEMLLDACVGTYVAGWHLGKKVRKLGNTWAAIGAYHSETPLLQKAYANSVAATLASWNLIEKGFWPFPEAPRTSAEAVALLDRLAGRSPAKAGGRTGFVVQRSDSIIALQD